MFLDKYEPNSFDNFVGNRGAKEEMASWANNFDNEKKPLLIVGPTGTGKSTAARILANVNNWQTNEISADEQRDKESLERRMELFVQSISFFNKRNLFIFEDLDFLSSKDKGAITKISEIVKIAKNPIIFTATDIYSNQKIKEISAQCRVVNFKRLTYLEISKKLMQIAQEEDIYSNKEALDIIAKNAKGDLRAAILDLEALADIGVTEKTLSTLGEREREDSIFTTLMNIQMSKNLSEAKKIQDSCNIDYDMQFAWVNENVSAIYNQPELTKAYDLISYADLMRNNIYKRQNWVFLKYYLMTGIVLPLMLPNKKFVKYSFPTFISKMSKEKSTFAKNKVLAKLVQKIVRGGSKKIVSEIYFYNNYFETAPEGVIESSYTTAEIEQIEKLLKIKIKRMKKEIPLGDENKTTTKNKPEPKEKELTTTKIKEPKNKIKQTTLF